MRRDAARILDEYLVASARAGDRADFSQLAERWQPKLLAHAYRLMGDRGRRAILCKMDGEILSKA